MHHYQTKCGYPGNVTNMKRSPSKAQNKIRTTSWNDTWRKHNDRNKEEVQQKNRLGTSNSKTFLGLNLV